MPDLATVTKIRTRAMRQWISEFPTGTLTFRRVDLGAFHGYLPYTSAERVQAVLEEAADFLTTATRWDPSEPAARDAEDRLADLLADAVRADAAAAAGVS